MPRLLIGSLTRPAPHIGPANGEGVVVCTFDERAGTLQREGAPLPLQDASWIAPGGGSAWVVTDHDGGAESALTRIGFGADGTPEIGPIWPAGGWEGCHAAPSPDGRLVAMTSYGGPRDDGPDAGLALFDGATGERQTFRHEGSGPNADRQEAPHAHCATWSPDGRFLFICDLGIDLIVAYERSGAGVRRSPELDTALPPGTGPRHLVFGPAPDRAWLIAELIGGVTSLGFDTGTGRLSLLHAESLAAPGGAAVQPAGLVAHPGGRHLYATNRLTDEIVVLAADGPDGTAPTLHRAPSGGATPRDLTLSPSGRHLLVANQEADEVTVWPLSEGLPDPTPSFRLPVGSPLTLAFV
ncbi:lactonase family protein [Pseudoroseicyclus tamaricis]|uniref:Lactonase family protein n=1 Tax=Pseudoroseicyclus tamaricis TaxID=2705421 RepID=A0A6B2JZ27_9RHOB|nr:beta-propeller fold lactonase family protein [Pseudoroseicyclus tamaricis]NDU99375.1 lactonase family protein [Pseudoroseicyclus tamaricis]